MKRIIIAVTNDLVSDQRVHRIACSLVNMGFEVLLTGRKLDNSVELQQRPYKTRRVSLAFNKGPLFYAEYNIRLFFFLLFKKFDIAVANDLDTLSGAFLASKIKCKKLVYDSHEYFTEVPELINRNTTRSIWLMIEKMFLPRVKYSYTVCGSIAKIYSIKYGIKMKVVRNLPVKNDNDSNSGRSFRQAQCPQVESFKMIYESDNLLLKINQKKIIIYQGALNLGRGLELVIKAMKHIENAVFVIIGDGDIAAKLKALAKTEEIENKVIFTGKKPFEEIYQYTTMAHVGISLEENLGLNYYYSLPNKLFDYIQAKVPVLVSDFPEMKKIVTDYNIGIIAEKRTPEAIAAYLQNILNDQEMRTLWKENLEKAAVKLCWENEEKKLAEIFEKLK